MFKKTILATALVAVFGVPGANVFAQTAKAKPNSTESKELAEIRAQMQLLKDSYEARLQALEKRLAQAEETQVQAQKTQAAVVTAPQLTPIAPISLPPPSKAVASVNAFNPAIAINLSGTMTNLSQDPSKYLIQGFVPSGGEVGPGARSFSLGESEITLSANVDPNFSGQLTFSMSGENTVSVEESFFQTKKLFDGSNLKVGRFLSSIGYLNSQHAHAWDFVDAPLAYQAFFGGQYKPDGAQMTWLVPTDSYLEFGAEVGTGKAFPANAGNKNGFGSTALFAHMGDDLGDNASWRAGVSYLQTRADNRPFGDSDRFGFPVNNQVSGNSKLWIADAILKWAPDGNSVRSNVKLQAEYFSRKEDGSLDYRSGTEASQIGKYASSQSGWYLQTVYQFVPQWRVGARYDRLSSGKTNIGIEGLSLIDFPILQSYNPTRSSLMLDYSLSEFSRLRLQFARDNSRFGVTDNQIFLQYNMSLGAHGAHTF